MRSRSGGPYSPVAPRANLNEHRSLPVLHLYLGVARSVSDLEGVQNRVHVRDAFGRRLLVRGEWSHTVVDVELLVGLSLIVVPDGHRGVLPVEAHRVNHILIFETGNG